MAKKLTMLPPPKNPPCPVVIAFLKDLLTRAESGEVNGLAVVASMPRDEEDGKATFSTFFTANPNRDLLGFLGSVRILEARVLHKIYVPERDDQEGG